MAEPDNTESAGEAITVVDIDQTFGLSIYC